MRIRTIKPEFWHHPVMARLPDHVQLIALGLLNAADDEGYFRADPNLVRADIAPFTEDSLRIHGALTTLSKVGWIQLCEHPEQGPIGRVVNFKAHQAINRPTPSKIKAYWLTESSLSPHGVLTEPSLLEQGTGNRERNISTPPPPAREDVGEIPSLDQTKAAVMSSGIPDEFVSLVYETWTQRNGKDGAGIAVQVVPYVRSRWSKEGAEWRNGTHRSHPKQSHGNSKNSSGSNRNSGTTNDGKTSGYSAAAARALAVKPVSNAGRTATGTNA